MGVFESLLAPVMGLTLGPLAAPLISAGTSLLGGAINAKNERKAIAAQNAYNDPAQIRARAEAAGFNPLSFIGPGVGNQTAAASGAYMGSAIADAGMAMADGIANRTKVKQAEQLGALEIENAKLQNKLLQLTLRPKVGGVYAERQSTPTIAAAVGGGNAAASGGVSSTGGVVNGGGDSRASSPLLTDQTVQEKPTEGLTGFMMFRNRMVPEGMYVPGSDGDVMDIWQIPTVIASYGAHKAIEAHNAPNPRPSPYINPGVLKPSKKARVIGGGNISASPNPAKRASEVAAIKAVDPSYVAGSSPSWHKYRQKAWWQ